MNYVGIEETYLTYYKLFDSLDLAPGYGMDSVCDLSFNDFVTARYLVEKRQFPRVYSLTRNKMINLPGIYPVKVVGNVASTLGRIRSDFCLSLGGSYRFQPLYDVVYAIHDSLNVGGKFLFAVQPDVYDETGRDVLADYGRQSELAVKEKLNRWFTSVNNAMSNLFVNIRVEEVITDTSPEELKALLASDCFNRFLFRNEDEYTRFFQPLETSSPKLYLVWKIIKGLKV